jgi:hypothetical protein
VKKNCDEQNVPFFFKQWGKSKFNPNPDDPTINKEHRYHSKGGSQLDGKYIGLIQLLKMIQFQ